MRKEWLSIASVWLLVAVGALYVIMNLEQGDAIRSFGVLAAGSLALVSLVHLFSSHSEGIVRRLIFSAGGAYAILAVAGLYILLLG
ncbi:MAG: hypothetical protein WCK24_05525 [Actinomycetes bacterium]